MGIVASAGESRIPCACMSLSRLVVAVLLFAFVIVSRPAGADEPPSPPLEPVPAGKAPPPEPSPDALHPDAPPDAPRLGPPPEPPPPELAPSARPRLQPLRIAVECESHSRTKACPDFLIGFIEASPLLLASPRASAQVVLYVAVVPVANDDRFHLRFVGNVRGAPASIEVDVDVNTRGTDDEQLAQLRPAFLRGVALYVATLNPGAVKIELVTPEAVDVTATATSPWGFKIFLYGSGNWTEGYQSANGNAEVTVQRVERTSKYSANLGTFGGLSRRPPLVVDGMKINLDTREWEIYSGVFGSHHLAKDWAVSSSLWWSENDPKGQFDNTAGGNIGLEWDRYPSDDPRGNVLAVAYFLALRNEVYNFPNELGQTRSLYPYNRLSASARVRKDKINFGLNLTVAAEILHPTRRHDLSISPSIEWKLGDHVDVAFRFSLGKRAVPQPVIPDDDFEAQGRAAYAEPLYTSGFFTLEVHFDPTNGVRNNRFENL